MSELTRLVLYQLPGEDGLSYSPFVNKVRWALELKGLAFDTVVTGRVGRYSKTGRFPVLRDGEQLVHDSTEILLHLEREFPAVPLVPSEAGARARAWLLESWADESLMALVCFERASEPKVRARMARGALTALGLPRVLAPFAAARLGRSGQVRYGYLARLGREAVRGELLRHLDVIEAAASAQPWLSGESLSVADVAVAAVLHMPFITGADALVELITERPHTFGWLRRFYRELGRPEALRPVAAVLPGLAAPAGRAPSTAARL